MVVIGMKHFRDQAGINQVLRLFTVACVIWSSTAARAQAELSADGPEDDSPAFAFVALKEYRKPSEAAFRKALGAFLPKETRLDGIKIDDQGIVFEVDGAVAMIVAIPRPIPWRDLQRPCQAALRWPEAKKKMKVHRTHLLVSLVGGDSSFLERNVLLTKIIAGTTLAIPSIGVYWGHGDVVSEPVAFRDEAREASVDSPPVLLWVGIFPQRNPDNSISAITIGLEYFQCMDIEVMRSKQSLSKILATIVGAAYLQLVGDTFENGDTVGMEGQPNQKIKTRHEKSAIQREGPILLIEM